MGIIEEYEMGNSKIQIADDAIQREKEEEIWKEVCRAGAILLETERQK